MTDKKKSSKALILTIAPVVLLLVGLLIAAAAVGWFNDPKVSLDPEYYCSDDCGEELLSLTGADYESLIKEKKSFIVLVDQGGCTTADRLREYASEFAKERGVKVYRLMFAEEKETSLHDLVKYYPSVAIISKGKPVAYLRADSDADAPMYNNYDEFKKWMEKYL